MTQHIAALGFATEMGAGTSLDWCGLRQPMPRILTSLTRSKPRCGNGVAHYCPTNPAFFVSVVNWGAVLDRRLLGRHRRRRNGMDRLTKASTRHAEEEIRFTATVTGDTEGIELRRS